MVRAPRSYGANLHDRPGFLRSECRVTGPRTATGRVRPYDVPAAELAIAVHVGPFSDLDQTYGALGSYVAERAIGVAGPIREYYLVTEADTKDPSRHRTEVCWPIFRTTTRS